MSTEGTQAKKESKQWPFGFNAGFADQQAWQLSVNSKLTTDEQLEVGVRACITMESTSKDLADTLRNPQEPTRFILEAPFREKYNPIAKEIYNDLLQINEVTNPEEKKRKQAEVADKLITHLPPDFLEKMTHFYNAHMAKRGGATEETQAKAKQEFCKLITFQFAQAAILANTQNDIEKVKIISKQFLTLAATDAYKTNVKKLETTLDNNAKTLQPLGEISPVLQEKMVVAQDAANKKKPELIEMHDKVKSEAEIIFNQLSEIAKAAPGNVEIENQLTHARINYGNMQNSFNPKDLMTYMEEISKAQAKIMHIQKLETQADIDQKNPILRTFAEEVGSGEYFPFADDLKKMEALADAYKKDPSETKLNALKDMTLKISQDYFPKSTGSVSFDLNAVIALNLSGHGTPANLIKLGKAAIKNTESATKDNLTPTKIQELLNVFQTVRREYNQYQTSNMHSDLTQPAAKKIYQSEFPLHEYLKTDLKNSGQEAMLRGKLLPILLKKCDLNQKNKEGFEALQLANSKEQIDALLKAGAKTTHYERNFGTRLGDTLKGLFSGKGLTRWDSPPPRSQIEIQALKSSVKTDVMLKENTANLETYKSSESSQAQDLSPGLLKKLGTITEAGVVSLTATKDDLGSRPITPSFSTTLLSATAAPLGAPSVAAKNAVENEGPGVEKAESTRKSSLRQ